MSRKSLPSGLTRWVGTGFPNRTSARSRASLTRYAPLRLALGPAAHRQVAVARAGGAHALGRGCARRRRPRAHQRTARRCAEPRGASGRRGHRRARSQRAAHQGAGVRRAARLGRRRPRALRRPRFPDEPLDHRTCGATGAAGGRRRSADQTRSARDRCLHGRRRRRNLTPHQIPRSRAIA